MKSTIKSSNNTSGQMFCHRTNWKTAAKVVYNTFSSSCCVTFITFISDRAGGYNGAKGYARDVISVSGKHDSPRWSALTLEGMAKHLQNASI